jgi:hypothetical protein
MSLFEAVTHQAPGLEGRRVGGIKNVCMCLAVSRKSKSGEKWERNHKGGLGNIFSWVQLSYLSEFNKSSYHSCSSVLLFSEQLWSHSPLSAFGN